MPQISEDYDADWPRHNEPVDVDDEWLREFLNNAIGARCTFNKRLLGGLVNSNYEIELTEDARKYYLRVSVQESNATSHEPDAILSLVRPHVPVTKTIATSHYRNRRVVLQEWLRGMTLKSVVGQVDQNGAVSIGDEIGGVLAKLANIRFSTHGFLDGNGKVASEFRLDRNGYLEYLHMAIETSMATLGPRLCSDLWSFIESNAEKLNDIPLTANLVHGDFHPNNILLNNTDGEWKVTGVVDWDSALSWNTLHDVAHLVRRSFPNRTALEHGLIDRLKRENIWLPKNWESTRDLLQILGWVDKLAAGENREQVISTAKASLTRIAVG